MSTKLIAMDQIKFKELAAEITRLNNGDFVKDKINAVGKTKEELVDLFVKTVQAIPDDAKGNWTGPEETAAYYMSLVVPEKVAPVSKEKGTKVPKEKVPGKKNRLEVTGEFLKGLLEKDDSVAIPDAIAAADAAYVSEGARLTRKSLKRAMNVSVSVLKGYGAVTVVDGIISKV